jgi:hypothetical protein
MNYYESGQQKLLFQWAKLQEKKYPELYWLNSSGNGQHIANVASRNLATALGRKRGYPDINLPVPNKTYIGLYIEMKIKPKKPTTEQIKWLEGLKQLRHYTCVCYSYEEAKNVIMAYILNKE